MTNPGSSAIEGLKGAIRGQVLLCNDPAYEESRHIWNAMIDRQPALIVRCAGAADDLSVWAVRLAPPLPFLPQEFHGKPVIVFAICYSGAVESGARAIEAVRTFGKPCGEHIGPMPYAAWQKAFDPLLAPGSRNYWKSHNFDELPDGLFDAVVAAIEKLPSPQCEIFFGQIGGKTSRVAVDATAYCGRDAKYVMNVHGRWDNASEDARCIEWARAFFEAAAPFALGSVYVNFLTQEESGRIGAAYGPNYERLVEVKTRYDPRNLFRHNQNIKPSAP